MQGNEAVAEGALAAGLRFYGGYPITPSSEIAEILSRRLPKVGGVFIQMEDEIGSIASVIGASVGGLKAATATSGPGFSLMQENIGFAACVEVPCVIINVQRTGPSSGLPTSPAQGDVMQARWGTHGDHPIIALSASSVSDCFDITVRAFNLAEKYRTPVILLLDEVIGHLREKVVLPAAGSFEIVARNRPTVPPEWYFPYEENLDVPPLAPFGEGYRYHMTGLLHDRLGYPTMRLDEINSWLNRFFGKIDRHLDDIIRYKQTMMDDADVAIVTFGGSARPAKAAMHRARERGQKVRVGDLQTIWPFPEAFIRELASRVKLIVVPEMNLGQIRLEVERAACGQVDVRGVHRADGEMIEPQQVLAATEL